MKYYPNIFEMLLARLKMFFLIFYEIFLKHSGNISRNDSVNH